MFDSFETVDWETSCEFCLAPRAIRLSYFRGRDPSEEVGARIVRSLVPIGALRFGQLFRCRHCGRPWYDPTNGLCTSVERSWVPLLKRWNARPLASTDAQLLSMRTIGAVHWSSFGDTELRIPCRVCVAGSWYDPALAILQNRPLLMWKNPAPEVFCVDEVEALESSEFALPHKLRQRGATAPEKAMGYAPHSAYWGDIQVSLNGLVEFWGAGGQMGMDLKAQPERGDWRPHALDPRPFSDDQLTYVIGDLADAVLRPRRSPSSWRCTSSPRPLSSECSPPHAQACKALELPLPASSRWATFNKVPTARYDQVADFYESGWRDHYTDPVSVALFDLLGPLRGAHILDLACGHGRITRELARRGADVVGLDLSSVLLDRARTLQATDPLYVTYVHGDAASPSMLEGQVFDAVTCSFGLSDIDDLDGAVATVARLLAPAGPFVFSLLHPCFAGGRDVSGSWPSTGSYDDEGWWLADGALSSLRRQVGANHRMLSTYVNTLSRHGLLIDRLIEPRPPDDWSARRPDAATLPVFLVARARNPRTLFEGP